jgi:hypothetical protein
MLTLGATLAAAWVVVSTVATLRLNAAMPEGVRVAPDRQNAPARAATQIPGMRAEATAATNQASGVNDP